MREEFEKNLYLTYLDEVINYEFSDVSFKSIISLTILKQDYISNLEVKWNLLRKKYDIPDGFCLHFTEIKALLNPSHAAKKSTKESILGKIFIKNNTVDIALLKNFYNDILKIIEESNFSIVVTGYRFDKTFNNNRNLPSDYFNQDWYILFKMHLDNLAECMHQKSLINLKSARKSKKTATYKVCQTKLRYDGDFGLNSRDQFRDAYSHVITTGTQRFSNKFTKKCFDNLKFIDKLEVGGYEPCDTCGVTKISHAGNELLDFIAFYVSNIKCKDQMIIDVQQSLDYSYDKATRYHERLTRIFIKGEYIFPYNAIHSKIFS